MVCPGSFYYRHLASKEFAELDQIAMRNAVPLKLLGQSAVNGFRINEDEGLRAVGVPDVLDSFQDGVAVSLSVLAFDQDSLDFVGGKRSQHEDPQHLGRAFGLLVGISSGANVWAARQIAKRVSGNIATVLPDRAERYFSTALT